MGRDSESEQNSANKMSTYEILEEQSKSLALLQVSKCLYDRRKTKTDELMNKYANLLSEDKYSEFLDGNKIVAKKEGNLKKINKKKGIRKMISRIAKGIANGLICNSGKSSSINNVKIDKEIISERHSVFSTDSSLFP